MLRKLYYFVFLILLSLLSACTQVNGATSYLIDPQSIRYSGSGSQKMAIQGISGLSIVHIVIDAASPFTLDIETGQKTTEVLNASAPLDEYRPFEFNPSAQTTLNIQSDQPWNVTISPANPTYFSYLKIPGIYKSTGNAVVFLEGEYGVATFSIKSVQNFKAWAFGPGGVNHELYITPSGDYRGKSVLPQGTTWLIVSTKDTWAVDIQAPCCKVPPGIKPKYP